MLWNTFTELHLTLVSQDCCLKGLLACQDDKYLFVVVDMLVKYFYQEKSNKNAAMMSIIHCTYKMTPPEN